MVIEMLLDNDIVQMILIFEKEINLIMCIIENTFKFNFNHFIRTKSQ
jgi:hypothetical protein